MGVYIDASGITFIWELTEMLKYITRLEPMFQIHKTVEHSYLLFSDKCISYNGIALTITRWKPVLFYEVVTTNV